MKLVPEKKGRPVKLTSFEARRAAMKKKYHRVYADARSTRGLRWVPKREINEFTEHTDMSHEAEEVDGGPNLNYADGAVLPTTFKEEK